MTRLVELELRRPQRADARRNYDALIAAAHGAFAELGPQAPLEEIARRADVGIATLYRNFTTREELVEAVYLEEVEAVCRVADDVVELEPWSALIAWLDRLAAYLGTKRALIEALNRESSTLKACRQNLVDAGGPLLRRAQDAGVVRHDVAIDDVMRLVNAITGVKYADDGQRDKVLSLALDGLRPSSTA